MSGVTAKYCPPFKGKDGRWYWHLRAANGEIISQSQGYSTKEHAEEGIESAKAATSGEPSDSGAAED